MINKWLQEVKQLWEDVTPRAKVVIVVMALIALAVL